MRVPEVHVRTGSPINKKTLLIGDSILKGINKRGLLDNIQVCTLPGATSKDIALHLKKRPLQNFDKIVIYVGGNDNFKSGPRYIHDELKKSIQYLQETYSHMAIYLCAVCPRVDVNVTQVNELIKQLASQTSSTFINVYESFVYGDGRPVNIFYGKDRVHLNPTGTRALIMAINNVVEIIKRRNYDQRRQTGSNDHVYISREHVTGDHFYRRHANTSNLTRVHCRHCGRDNHTSEDCRLPTRRRPDQDRQDYRQHTRNPTYNIRHTGSGFIHDTNYNRNYNY